MFITPGPGTKVRVSLTWPGKPIPSLHLPWLVSGCASSQARGQCLVLSPVSSKSYVKWSWLAEETLRSQTLRCS